MRVGAQINVPRTELVCWKLSDGICGIQYVTCNLMVLFLDRKQQVGGNANEEVSGCHCDIGHSESMHDL